MAKDVNSNPPAAHGAQEEVPTLGSILKTARERHGLTVEQVAAELRVEPRLVEGLEEARFEVLPAPVFVKGYLKHLANRFDLEYDDLIAHYTEQTDVRDAPVTYNEPIPETSTFLVPLLIGALVLAVGIPTFWFTWVSRDSLSNLISEDEQAPVSPPAQVEPALEEAAPSPDAGIALEPAAQSPAAESDSGLQPPPPETAPGDLSAPEEPPVETDAADPALPDGDQPPGGATDSVAIDPQAASTVQVAIRYLEDSWTEVTDGNGNALYYALGRAGTTTNLDGVLPLSFTLGNAQGVQVAINDQPYPLPAPQGNATTIRFVIEAAP